MAGFTNWTDYKIGPLSVSPIGGPIPRSPLYLKKDLFFHSLGVLERIFNGTFSIKTFSAIFNSSSSTTSREFVAVVDEDDHDEFETGINTHNHGLTLINTLKCHMISVLIISSLTLAQCKTNAVCFATFVRLSSLNASGTTKPT